MCKHFKTIIILIVVGCILSCATPVCITSSNTPLNDKKITENLGKVEGESNSCFAILGLWMLGKPDIQTAIDDALNKKKADALINIKCYETTYYFIVGSITKVIVEGEAIKTQKQEQYIGPY